MFVEAFQLANRPVSNGEYLQFIRDGGYRSTALWLADGWDHIQRAGWQAETRPSNSALKYQIQEADLIMHGLRRLHLLPLPGRM